MWKMTLLSMFFALSQCTNVSKTYKENYYFAVFGDSIARGTGEAVGPTPSDGTVKEWNGTTFVNVQASDMINANIGSPWPNFGIYLNNFTGATINISHSGFGGSEFSPYLDTNNWSSLGTLYDPSKDKALNMLSTAGVSKIDGVIIILGINDARGTTAYETIQSDMQSLIDRINTDFNTPNIYLAQIGSAEFGDTQRVLDIRGFILNLVANNSNLFMAYDEMPFFTDRGWMRTDNLHPNKLGNDAMGKGFAEYIVTDINN